MSIELTEKQQRFLSYLETEAARTGKTPSLRRAASAMGVSHAAISQLIKALEKKGVVRRDGRYGRTVFVLTGTGRGTGAMRSMEIPVVGRIAAGLPLYAQKEWDGSIVVDADTYRGSTLFALRVKGHSMRDAAILDGDLVICEPRQFAEDGEIVVALIRQEEATVKRFFRRGNRIELCPENPDFEPVTYAFGEVLIQARVIGVYRGPDVMARLHQSPVGRRGCDDG